MVSINPENLVHLDLQMTAVHPQNEICIKMVPSGKIKSLFFKTTL